ncbi:MAG: riboflavin synthase [Saprospiraceae bacterium]|nr:riboflavin synthase [Saprospiraceae bacterium]
MFTGIIEASGRIIKIKNSLSNLELYIESPLTPQLRIDQSLSHDGACLTIDELGPDWHRCTLVRETLHITNFEDRHEGDIINLERAVKIDSRWEGHMVQGHIDAAVSCKRVIDQDGSWVYEFELPDAYSTLAIKKGSISVNGVSLTISDLKYGAFQVSIIPYTYLHTNFRTIQPGDRVNIEFDLIAKYLDRQLEVHKVHGFR